jgi:hypothetical protein
MLLDANSSLSAWETERVLEQTASDVGKPGLDNGTGHGAVDPVRAVRTARNRSDG